MTGPLPPVRPRFYTRKEMARRGRHRDPAFQRGALPPLPDYKIAAAQCAAERREIGASLH